jgi:SnoaL-like polyketide cyclase
MAWDARPEVRSPVGRPIAELLEHGPRRQDLPGFDPVYRDFVDYIIRCTHRIWEEKNIGLCRTHYGDDCVMHTLAGPSVGAETVVQGTIGALAMSSDRQVIGEDVIWSSDDDGCLYSSHRITSRMTHMGDDTMLGAATWRGSGVTTIADCACRENRIVEEWLVRDNWRAVAQIDGDPWVLAQAQAEDCAVPDDHPAAHPVAMLRAALRDDLFGDAAAALSSCAEVRWPSNRHGYGRGYWIGCATQLRALLHKSALRIEHVAARPLPEGDIAVAVRWSLAGVHGGAGLWGPPNGREILVMAVSHYRMRGRAIVEDITVFDELAILRQIAGGLGA